MIKWNSVEIIPKYDEHYLVYTESGHMHTIFYWADSWNNFIRPQPNGATITHWAELPPPPSSPNSDYMQCEYCHGTKLFCTGAGQCDYDGKDCNANDNCGEYTPVQCKHCIKC